MANEKGNFTNLMITVIYRHTAKGEGIGSADPLNRLSVEGVHPKNYEDYAYNKCTAKVWEGIGSADPLNRLSFEGVHPKIMHNLFKQGRIGSADLFNRLSVEGVHPF